MVFNPLVSLNFHFICTHIMARGVMLETSVDGSTLILSWSPQPMDTEECCA